MSKLLLDEETIFETNSRLERKLRMLVHIAENEGLDKKAFLVRFLNAHDEVIAILDEKA